MLSKMSTHTINIPLLTLYLPNSQARSRGLFLSLFREVGMAWCSSSKL